MGVRLLWGVGGLFAGLMIGGVIPEAWYLLVFGLLLGILAVKAIDIWPVVAEGIVAARKTWTPKIKGEKWEVPEDLRPKIIEFEKSV